MPANSQINDAKNSPSETSANSTSSPSAKQMELVKDDQENQPEAPCPPAELLKMVQRARYRPVGLYNLPTERQQDYMIDGKQAFLRPYADDLLKVLLTSPLIRSEPQRRRLQPKVIIAADLPRLALVHLIGQMASHKKLSFLGFNSQLEGGLL